MLSFADFKQEAERLDFVWDDWEKAPKSGEYLLVILLKDRDLQFCLAAWDDRWAGKHWDFSFSRGFYKREVTGWWYFSNKQALREGFKPATFLPIRKLLKLPIAKAD